MLSELVNYNFIRLSVANSLVKLFRRQWGSDFFSRVDSDEMGACYQRQVVSGNEPILRRYEGCFFLYRLRTNLRVPPSSEG